jgi:EAL domain-containing protein (putative c-di-GMP-specific phosphodiesterase class I)
MVMDALSRVELALEHLALEATEWTLMKNAMATRAVLQALREHGVRIALDDLCTGDVSPAYLMRMPTSHIQGDRCFVTGLLQGGESEAMVRAVLAVTHSPGLHVTAERMETIEKARALKAMAPDCLRDCCFTPPVLPQDIPAFLSRRWTLDDGTGCEREAGRTPQWPPLAVVRSPETSRDPMADVQTTCNTVTGGALCWQTC